MSSEKRPSVNNGHFFGVPRVAVVNRFDCNVNLNKFYPRHLQVSSISLWKRRNPVSEEGVEWQIRRNPDSPRRCREARWTPRVAGWRKIPAGRISEELSWCEPWTWPSRVRRGRPRCPRRGRSPRPTGRRRSWPGPSRATKTLPFYLINDIKLIVINVLLNLVWKKDNFFCSENQNTAHPTLVSD